MERVDELFRQAMDDAAGLAAAGHEAMQAYGGVDIDPVLLLGLFDSQLISRHADLAARELGRAGTGYYTIGSSGHEGNAAVAAALRPDDPALLHYRAGAFYAERARQAGGLDPLRDILLGVVAAADEPIAGGRHKVFGRHELNVIPQTSTIASHLPRAVGVAFSVGRGAKIGAPSAWPDDAVVVCSFGDASANHSTATGAVNAAVQAAYRGLPMPLLLVCEDNGIGISVNTPRGWVEHIFGGRPGLEYFRADGTDIVEAWSVASRAAAWVRQRRRPAVIHLDTVRLMGHAGSDVETAYRSQQEIVQDLDRDPLLRTARYLVGADVLTAEQVRDRYEATGRRAAELVGEVVRLPKLDSAAAVMRPLRTQDVDQVLVHATTSAPKASRERFFADKLPEDEGPLTLAQAINRSLGELLATDPGVLVFGEDVAAKGGVYGVTRGLVKRAGRARVFDTLLDEQTVLGLALGAGVSGLLPIPEIQYLAYLHNAEDQIRGEGATLGFFSAGQYANPMVVRIAGYAYQKGFGGHFHNDNSVAVLRDIPGLVIASPSNPQDAAAMLRTCAAVARVEQRVCVFLEPIALYHARDLYVADDGGWAVPYPAPDSWASQHVPVGYSRTYGDGNDLTIVSFANGFYMSQRVARRLAVDGVSTRVVDLRWLAPLPVADILAEAQATGRLLVVDETRRTGGVGESIVARVVQDGFTGQIACVASEDSFIPLGGAANHVLVSERDIEQAARNLISRGQRR